MLCKMLIKTECNCFYILFTIHRKLRKCNILRKSNGGSFEFEKIKVVSKKSCFYDCVLCN